MSPLFRHILRYIQHPLLETGLWFIFLQYGILEAQTSAFNYWFDDSKSFLNQAIPDSDYVTHDGFYNLFTEAYYSQESLAGIDGKIPSQAMLSLQWFPNRQRKSDFRWKFGGLIYRDQFGLSKYQFIRMSAGIQWFSSKGDILAAAISAGYQQWNIKLSEQDLLQFGDPLGRGNFQNQAPDLGIGVYFNKRVFAFHDVYLGLSIPQLIIADEANVSDWKLNKQVSIIGGMNIFFTDYGHLESVIHINSAGDLLINIRNHFRKSFWMGMGYDLRGIANVEFGIRIRNILTHPQVTKSQNNYWRMGIGYRFWPGNIPAEFGNLIGVRMAYIVH